MGNKWFNVHGGYFNSKRRAMNIDEAWKKTLKKWKLISEGKRCGNDIATCGFCDLFYEQKLFYSIAGGEPETCNFCPIKSFTGKRYCAGTPYELGKIGVARSGRHKKILDALELEFLVFLRKFKKLERKVSAKDAK